jgi:hypothetical protein
LIWAVRLVRTGGERGYAAPIRIWLRHSGRNNLLAAATGMGAAALLQSSTEVSVLVSNFVSKGGLATAAGLAILLGADVGSAVVTLDRQNDRDPVLLANSKGAQLRCHIFREASQVTVTQPGTPRRQLLVDLRCVLPKCRNRCL